MSSLLEFLNFLWEDTAGYVNISVLSKEGAWKRSFAQWPRQRNAVENFINEQTAIGSEVYLAPALWKGKPKPGEQYTKDLFLGSHVLWAEFDGNAPDNWDQSINNPLRGLESSNPIDLVNSPHMESNKINIGLGTDRTVQDQQGSTDAGGSVTSQSGLPSQGADPAMVTESNQGIIPIYTAPSVIIRSSSYSHQHVYWKLDKLLTDPNLLENLNRTLAFELDADNCWDCTRVLRPPETVNYGINKPERQGKTYPVQLEEFNDSQYPVTAFRQTKDFRPMVRESLGKIPDIKEVLARRTWDAEMYKAFMDDPPDKKRSDIMMFLAYSAAEAGFTDEEIYAVILDCDNRWKKFTGRLDRDKWLIDIVERARAKHPLSDEVLTFAGLLGTGGKEKKSVEVPDKIVYALADFMKVEVKLEWIAEGLLPRGGYGFIAGQNGIGKSQLGIRLCEAVVEGKIFLNKWNCVPIGAKAMFLSLEMELVELKEFYTTMHESGSFFPTGGDRFFTAPIGNDIPLDKEEGYKFLVNLLREHQPDLLVIDSLSMAMSGSFREDGSTLAFNKVIKRLRVEFGVAIVVIHHNRKGQDKKFRYNELDDLYGSRFLAQDTSFVLMLDKPKSMLGNKIAINQAKMRFSKTGSELITEHENMNFINTIDSDSGEIGNFSDGI